MRISLRILLLILALPFVFGPEELRVSAQTNYPVYLPLVSKAIPPERLGPYLSPAAIGFAIDPSNSAVVYAGTHGGGVYKTVNGGADWTPASLGLPTGAQIQSMAIDPRTPLRVYAGLYYNGAPDFASGVYRSDNGGATWTATGRMDNLSAGVYSNRVVVYALSVSPDGGTLYAATRTKVPVPPYTYGYGGIFKSTNYGQTWALVNTGLPQDDLYVYDVAIDPANPSTVYAGLHGSGVYRTTNGGGSWVEKNNGIAAETADSTADRSIVVNPSATNQVLFGTAGRNEYASFDWANNWNIRDMADIFQYALAPSRQNGLYASTTPGSIYFSSSFGGSWSLRSAGSTNAFFNVDPVNENTLYAGGQDGTAGTKKSLDGGRSFFAVTHGISGYPVSGLVADPLSDSRLYAALFGRGVLLTVDSGASWAQVNTGLPTLSIQGLEPDPGNPSVLYALTLANGVYRTTNGGAGWSALNSGYPTAVMALSSLDRLPFQEIEPLESPFGLETNPPPVLNAAAPLPATALAVSPFSSSAVLAGTAGAGVVRWSGTTWTATSLSSGTVNTLLFDRGIPGRVWLGGDLAAGSLQVSADQGATWSGAANGLGGRVVYALSQSASNENILLAGTDAGVYLSLDRGAHWNLAGLDSQPVKAVAVHSIAAGRLLAGTAVSLYVSDNNGVNWRQLDPHLDGFDFLGLAESPTTPGVFYAASRYGGVVRFYP